MKKVIISFLAIFLASFSASGQQMIGITPYADKLAGIPEAAVQPLQHKLTQLVTQNGFGSLSGEFVLTCNVLVVNKSVVPTTPAQYSMDLEVSFYLVNALEQVIVTEIPVAVSSLESNETKAYIQAFNQINPRNPKLRTFMSSCREKIEEYYAARLPVLVAKAQSLAQQNKYEQAMAILGTIPESVSEYMVVSDLCSQIYGKMLDRNATVSINKAKSALTQKDYNAALAFINEVDPASSLAKQAYAMIDTIQGSIDEQLRLENEAQLKQATEQKALAEKVWDDRVMLTKLQIDAAKKAAIAQANAKAQAGESQTIKKLSTWLFGKLGK